MDLRTRWVRENVQSVVHDLHLPVRVIEMNEKVTLDQVKNAAIIWIRGKLQNVVVEKLKQKQLIVDDYQTKDNLIEKGLRGAQIEVCPFVGPVLPEWDVTPAAFADGQRQLIDASDPIPVAVSKAHRLGGLTALPDADEAMLWQLLTISLLAGVPVLAPRATKWAEIVNQFQIGTTDSSVEVTADQYQQWASQCATVGRMMLNGEFVKRALLNRAMAERLTQTDVANAQPRYGIQVMDSMATLDYIAQHHCSVARLGDGEISLLQGAAQVFQDEDPVLRRRLDEIVKTTSNDRLLVCLSDTFHDLDRYVPSAQDWWNGHLNVFRDYYQELGKLHHQYGNTMVTRPYMDLQDRSQAGEIFRRIKQWWNQRDVLIVEGAYTRSGVGNDLYDNAKSVQRIICPPKNAWAKYQDIEAAIKRYGRGRLVLVMLGMAATVIATDLADWGQVIDSGHLDPEYEWYRMGATKRVPIKGKHTAEMNYDQGVPQQINDPKYQAEIILDLNK